MTKRKTISMAVLIFAAGLIFTLYKTNMFEQAWQLSNKNSVQQEKTAEEHPTVEAIPKNTPIPEPTDPALTPHKAVTKTKEIKEINGLVQVSDLDDSIALDLKYATSDNFTGKVIYPVAVCLLQKETAQKLVKANEEFKKKGYSIKIWDAYRPVYVQQIFWDIVKDSRFVANPATGGSIHNRGTAVDLTLVDAKGKEVKMPTKFDDFSTNAYRNNSKMDPEAKKNMDYLTDVMKRNGFNTIDTEWWHFDDSNASKYKIVDVKLDEFINATN